MKEIKKSNFINNGLISIKKEAIIEINFGLKAQEEDILVLKEINEKFYSNKLKILKAKEKLNSFELNFYQIT